jgi:hypothetical protein
VSLQQSRQLLGVQQKGVQGDSGEGILVVVVALGSHPFADQPNWVPSIALASKSAIRDIQKTIQAKAQLPSAAQTMG